MSNSWRPFEVLLPLRFNDGRAIPRVTVAETVRERVDPFGSASHETRKVEDGTVKLIPWDEVHKRLESRLSSKR